MKKFILFIFINLNLVFASDPITIDSMFKNQQGLRSITSFQFLSSGSSNSFSTYPDLSIINDGKSWQDTKSLSLSQTFLYDVSKNIDTIISFNGSSNRREFFDWSSGYGHEDKTNFDSLWIGATYSFNTIGIFKPDVTLQTAIYQNDRYLDKSSNSNLKSYSSKISFKNYSDPVITNLFIASTFNQKKKIGEHNIDNGDSYSLGFDMSIILSPKISIDVGMNQKYQTETKIDNIKYSNSLMISTMNIGATYSISPKSSLSVSSSLGGSSASPDSIMSVSFWQKF